VRTTRSHHLQDDQLLDCYLAETAGLPLDPPAAEHLADCLRCGDRYAGLAQFHDAVRAEGAAESDEVFTPERLQAQQQHIARRIGSIGRAARVLSFPSQFVSRRIGGSSPRVATRWIAAAAAAGLFVGVGAGMFLDNAHSASAPVGQLASVQRASGPHAAHLAPAAARARDDSEATDDAFLSELDTALARPHTPELAPFDALTPRVREVTNQIR
jgi:hypothetical protein